MLHSDWSGYVFEAYLGTSIHGCGSQTGRIRNQQSIKRVRAEGVNLGFALCASLVHCKGLRGWGGGAKLLGR